MQCISNHWGILHFCPESFVEMVVWEFCISYALLFGTLLVRSAVTMHFSDAAKMTAFFINHKPTTLNYFQYPHQKPMILFTLCHWFTAWLPTVELLKPLSKNNSPLQVLEINDDYTPVVSAFKQGIVMQFEPQSRLVKVKVLKTAGMSHWSHMWSFFCIL